METLNGEELLGALRVRLRLLLEEQLAPWDADRGNLSPDDTQGYDDDLGGGDVSLTRILGTLTSGTLECTQDVESAAILIRTRVQDGDPS